LLVTEEAKATDRRILLSLLRAGVVPGLGGNFFQSPSDLDLWKRLIPLAKWHAVEALLFASLRSQPRESLPLDPESRLRANYEWNARKNLYLSGQLLQISRLFARKGILAVPVKGPLLASAAYGDVGLRTFSDLDFVVRRQNVLSARDILLEAGFQMYSGVHWPSNAAYLRSINSEFTMCKGEISVDLHWRLLPAYFPFHLDSESLWADVITQTIGGTKVPAFSPEHQLLYLAAHGTKHYWAKLRWACDMARFLQVEQLDWSRVHELSRAAGNPNILSHALALVRNLFQMELPEQAARWIDSAAEEIAGRVESWILQSDGIPPGFREGMWFLRRMTNGIGDEIRLLHGMTFAPTEAEWKLIQLPGALYPLYYPIRLGRLAVKYFPVTRPSPVVERQPDTRDNNVHL
jgi:hypothetical protein